jgi:predicted TIM-barrel fold metal-dependent hydrolase
MHIIDFHTHIFPDKIAAKTVDMLGAEANITPAFDGSRAGLLQSMASAGIETALNCPIATKPEQVTSINRWAASQNCRPIFSLGTLHPDSPDVAAELDAIRNLGLPGIKLHPEYQLFHPCEERMQPIWEGCCDRNLFVLMHCGEDIGFEPPYHSSPEEIAELLDAFPKLELVAAHMGSWMRWDAVETHLCGRANLYLETSFTLDYTSEKQFLRMIRAHGADRVVFGSDAPWRVPAEALGLVTRTALDDHEKQLILRDNARALLARHGIDTTCAR